MTDEEFSKEGIHTHGWCEQCDQDIERAKQQGFKEGEQRGREQQKVIILGTGVKEILFEQELEQARQDERKKVLEEIIVELESHANCQDSCFSKKRTEAWDVNYEIPCLQVLSIRIEALKKKGIK